MKFNLSRDPWDFQLKAISNIVNDFKNNSHGRYLLVLPTGGGKTLTAIRIINEMVNNKSINTIDRVLWVVHTLSLHSNAKKSLNNQSINSKFKLHPEIKNIIEVRMKSDALAQLEQGQKYKYIIIDEAHHASAGTYLNFFDYPLGILGLTATPSRTDQKELPFEKISYSITFKELVKRGVVLLPKFLPELNTDLVINSNSLQDDEQLESFNTDKRNQMIAHYIFREAHKYNFKKVIVFVGTNSHVKSLFDTINRLNNLSKNKFEHIGYIFGGNNNDKNITNEEYLNWHHSKSSSILINCKILNEGYDDPNIDTVVMATPTNSILYYMQCVGRVVRTPNLNKEAKAYVIEITDKLPNISYRIDNRWLFAEISDFLEPEIIDINWKWPIRTFLMIFKIIKLKAKISDLSKNELIKLILGKKINLLLFNDVPDKKIGKWRILTIPENDEEKIYFFNNLSENIEIYYDNNHDYILEQKYLYLVDKFPLNSRVYRVSLISALHRAFVCKENKKKVDSLIYLSLN